MRRDICLKIRISSFDEILFADEHQTDVHHFLNKVHRFYKFAVFLFKDRGVAMICKIYGIVDIISGLIIYFGTGLPFPIKLLILLIMLFKGIPSLFG